MRYLTAYGAALAVFVALDFTWFTMIARGLYVDEIGPLLLAQGRIAPAAAFYLLYVAGIAVFVIVPALERGGWVRALAFGALFGLVAYGAYDLTNLATLKGFTVKLAVIDMAWGAVATALAAGVGYAVGPVPSSSEEAKKPFPRRWGKGLGAGYACPRGSLRGKGS